MARALVVGPSELRVYTVQLLLPLLSPLFCRGRKKSTTQTQHVRSFVRSFLVVLVRSFACCLFDVRTLVRWCLQESSDGADDFVFYVVANYPCNVDRCTVGSQVDSMVDERMMNSG